ncbi:O-antigen ligase family protein [Kroppenstedtia pulmonis]|uniref:O-antigen ligase family protein n=1 Tax=Kroppenstedtia pulmonis TaxID=1380685 RepID=A0A7D4B3U5_9BACL|nr:O-antigen ligase family protein [Kroppenstedtia pulmonis]QKG85686.1 O-antigen ligase family protein [Kroppenstedtia pulmonis]
MSALLLPRQQGLKHLFHLTVVLAVLGPTLGIPMPGFNMTLFRLVFLLLLTGVVVKCLSASAYIPDLSHMSEIRWVLIFFASWTAYGVVSLIWASHLGYGTRYVLFLGTMLLLCLSFPYFLRTPDQIAQSGKVLFGVYSLIVVFGLIEALTYWHLPASRYYGTDSPHPTSFFTNQNDFATAITLGLPFLITAMYQRPLSIKWKGWIYTAGIIALCCLFLTGSRSNTGFVLPLILVACLVMIPLSVEREKRKLKHLLQGLGLAVMAGLIVFSLLSTVLSDQTRDKLGTTLGILDDIQGSWQTSGGEGDEEWTETASGDQSISIRMNLMFNALRFLADSGYFGVGAGNIEYHMQGAPGVKEKVNVHNWWLEVLVNFGVLVFLPYLFLYGWLLWQLFRLAWVKASPHLPSTLRWGATGSLIALIGYGIGAMAPSTAIHFTPMWIVLGFALAVIAVGKRHIGKTGEEKNGEVAEG